MHHLPFEIFDSRYIRPSPVVQVAAGVDQDMTVIIVAETRSYILNCHPPLPFFLNPPCFVDFMEGFDILGQGIFLTEIVEVCFDLQGTGIDTGPIRFRLKRVRVVVRRNVAGASCACPLAKPIVNGFQIWTRLLALDICSRTMFRKVRDSSRKSDNRSAYYRRDLVCL